MVFFVWFGLLCGEKKEKTDKGLAAYERGMTRPSEKRSCDLNISAGGKREGLCERKEERE